MEVTGNGQVQSVVDRAQLAGDEAKVRSLQQKRSPHTREDLARTAREFEGVFLNMMLGAMRQTVPESDLMGGSATRMYQQMHDAEMAKVLSGTGEGFGIAKLLESQFASQFATDDPAAALGDDGGGEAGVGAASGEGDLLGAARPGHGLPASLALSRYRQNATHAADTGAPRPVTARDVTPTPLALPAAGPVAPLPDDVPAGTAPTAATADHTEERLPRREAAPAAAPPTATDAARPLRVGLVPTDRGLAAAGLAPAEADTVRRFGDHIEKSAADAGLDPRLVLAVVMEESGGNPSARSAVGARGLMQLMPGTARQLGVHNALDPAATLAGGSRYLSEQLDRFDGRLDLALAAYNAGPGAVARAGGRVPGFGETRAYVQRVMQRYERLQRGTELDTGQE